MMQSRQLDFVYLRYAIGEDRRANFMFDELLTEYDMSRTEFDEFFAANKDNYADPAQTQRYYE